MHSQKFKPAAGQPRVALRPTSKAAAASARIPAGVPPADKPPLPSFLTTQPDGVVLAIKLQPRASRNEIIGPLGDELRIKLTAPPVDSAANEALIHLLADRLDCPRSAVQLVRGHTSRHKVIALRGVSADVVLARLAGG